MKIKPTTLILLFSSLLFMSSCHTKQPEQQQSDLEIMLTNLVEDRYAHCNQLSKSNEKMSRCEWADEMMEECNQLLDSQEPYREKYKGLRSLMKRYDIHWPYGINGTEMDSMNFALMVRVV